MGIKILNTMPLTNEAIYSGKVRDVFKISDNTLLMRATNRISSFNKVIGEVPNKGKLINLMSAHWLSITKHIIPNHLLFYNDDYSIVESCTPFKIEVIVRGYMTGSTET